MRVELTAEGEGERMLVKNLWRDATQGYQIEFGAHKIGDNIPVWPVDWFRTEQTVEIHRSISGWEVINEWPQLFKIYQWNCIIFKFAA